MGRYVRKGKVGGEVAVVMDLAPHSTLGVRTRAKTLALQRLLLRDSASPASLHPGSSSSSSSSSSSFSSSSSSSSSSSAMSYLQLRNRRLEKPPPASRAKVGASCKGGARGRFEKHVTTGERGANSGHPKNDGPDEASFGENIPELESRSRDVRETTPCSMILGSEVIGTPGSTTQPRNLSITDRRVQHAGARGINPTDQELEEFFAGAEELQQRMFLEKYNYDSVNDCPLPGRFEWVRLNS